MTPCFVCGGPYHPATGGLHDNGLGGLTPFCGPCERDTVAWLARYTSRRMRRIRVNGKTRVLRFYDYAHVPPEAA